MADKILVAVITAALASSLVAAPPPEPPLDDAYSFTHIGEVLGRGASVLGQDDALLVRVDDETRSTCIVYGAHVTDVIRGQFRTGQRLHFVDTIRTAEWYLAPQYVSGDIPLTPYPRLSARREFLVLANRRPLMLGCSRALAQGSKFEVLELTSCMTVRVDVHGIREILATLKHFAEVLDRPAVERPGPLRKILFANLDTKHEYLRHLIQSEFAYNEWAYPGMSKDEATRLANYSEGVDNYRRFHILEKLATKTPYPMDHWYLRALSRGTPGQVRAGDTEAVMAFDDSLNRAAPHLSIDSFWPMLERKTRPMSMWVHAFAKKRDLRLLPIILRYLDPASLDPTAADALENYRDLAAAEEVVVRAATDQKVKSDKRARALARESLKRLGTPRAMAVAEQLAGDDDNESGPPGRNR